MSHPGLANRTDASVEVGAARSQNCSFRLCYSLDLRETRSLQQTRLHKNCQFGTATSDHRLKWSQGTPALCRRATEDIAFLIRLHPPCSDSFCLSWEPPSFCQSLGRHCWSRSGNPKIVVPSCAFYWAHLKSFGTRLEIDPTHHAAVVLLVLGSTLVLPIAQTPLLKL